MKLLQGDCRQLVLEASHDGDVDAIITDPPYEIGIANQGWDKTGVAHDPETWESFRTLLKPGGYVLAFGSTRNHHHLAMALEEAGYTIQDEIPWLYAQGYPKREGLLKPANEPIVVARNGGSPSADSSLAVSGRWPANLAVDESVAAYLADQGAPPFAFVAKPSPGERRLGAAGAYHETVKPLKLMRWLVKLFTREGDRVLDPFMGSGTTIAAALIEKRDAVGIERDPDHFQNATIRIADLVAPYGIVLPREEPTNAT